MSDLLFRMVARWAVTTRTSGNELPGQRKNFGIFPDERSAKQALADAGFTNTEFGWRLVGGYTSADIEKQVVYEQTESAAEITRLTEALAASEEARRAERAAVVRECAKVALGPGWQGLHEPNRRKAAAAISALATDADNAALDKLLREARKVKPLEWEQTDTDTWSANSIFGPYITWEIDGDWFLASPFGGNRRVDGNGKTAAQADYEASILAALEAQQ